MNEALRRLTAGGEESARGNKKYECEEQPNLWALRLMEHMQDNLFLRSDLLNDAYRPCIRVQGEEVRRHRGLHLVEREDERDAAGRGL